MEREFSIWYANEDGEHQDVKFIVKCETNEDYEREVEATQSRILAEGGTIIMVRTSSSL